MERQIEKKSKKIDRFDAELFRLSDGRVNTVEINAFVDSRNRLELVHVRRLSFVDITIYSFSFFSSFQSPLLCICLECHLYLLITLKLQRVKEHKITFSSSSSSHFVRLSFWRIQELARNDNHLPNYDKSFGCSQHFPWNFRFFRTFIWRQTRKSFFLFSLIIFMLFDDILRCKLGQKTIIMNGSSIGYSSSFVCLPWSHMHSTEVSRKRRGCEISESINAKAVCALIIA